jgi:large subunit ribosomal protein L17
MFRNQLTALFTHERIITTVAKAKELRPLAERMVTLARNDTLHGRRQVLRMVPDKQVVQRLYEDIAPRFAGRPGGYTRILRLGRRKGDGAELAIIEFVDFEPGQAEERAGGESKGSLMDRAKGMFGGRKTEAAGDEPADEAVEAAAETTDTEEPAAPKKKAKSSKTAKKATEPEASAAAEEQVAAEAEAEPVADEPQAEADSSETETATDDEDDTKDAK